MSAEDEGTRFSFLDLEEGDDAETGEVDGAALAASAEAGNRDADDEADAASGAGATGLRPGSQSATGLTAGRSGPPPTGSPSLADLLDGRTSTFVVHKSHQGYQRLPELMALVRRRVRDRVGVGVAIRLPRHQPKAAVTFLDSCGAATVKIADPEVYTVDGSGWGEKELPKAAAKYSYTRGVPATVDAGWVTEVLEAQRDAGANVYLSASGWVGDQQAQAQLRSAMAWVAESRAALGPDEPMFVNLTLASGWLSNPALRSLLIEEM